MEYIRLADGEYHFTELVWEHEPVNSTELSRLAFSRLGWKKSTCYTVLHKLCARGILKNEQAVVTALVSREQIQKQASEEVIKKNFGNSLPAFLTAFLKERTLTQEEADELQALIDAAKEKR